MMMNVLTPSTVLSGLRRTLLRGAIATAVGAVAIAAQAGTATLEVGGTTATLEITYCDTAPRQSGQLAIEAEVTAVGTFRGTPAVLFLSKSAPVSGGSGFEQADLVLMSAPPEVANAPSIRASNDYRTEIMNRFGEMEKAANADISRESMEGLTPEEMTARFEEFQEKVDAIHEQRDAAVPPRARIFGTVTVDGTEVTLSGGEFRPIDQEDDPAFAGVSGTARIVATCGD